MNNPFKEAVTIAAAVISSGVAGIGLMSIISYSSPRIQDAVINCQPYQGQHLQLTKKFSEDEVPFTFMADTICRAETDLGTVVGYVDSRSRFHGFSNFPGDDTSGRLPD